MKDTSRKTSPAEETSTLAADLDEVDDETVLRLLQKVETLRKKIEGKSCEERESRRRRDIEEGNRLISGFGDPRVVEKWRIYKMVEERAKKVEEEVAAEVSLEMERRRRKEKEAKNSATKSTKELLRRVEKLKEEVKEELNIDLGAKAQVTQQSKTKLPLKKDAGVPVNGRRATPGDTLKSSTLSLPSQRPILAKKSFLPPQPSQQPEWLEVSKPSPNVALLSAKYIAPRRRRAIIHMSCHILPGVSIAPVLPNLQSSPIIRVVEQGNPVQIDSALKMDNVNNLESSGVHNIVVVEEVLCESDLKEEKNVSSDSSYSEQFEEEVSVAASTSKNSQDNSETEEEEEDEEDPDTVKSITDRLSTIPEDTRENKSGSSTESQDEKPEDEPPVAVTAVVAAAVEDVDQPREPVVAQAVEAFDATISEGLLSDTSLSISEEGGKDEVRAVDLPNSNEKNSEGKVSLEKVDITCKGDDVMKVLVTAAVETQTSDLEDSSNKLSSDTSSSAPEADTTSSSTRFSSISQEEVMSVDTELSEGQVVFSAKDQLSEGEISTSENVIKSDA